MVSLFCNLDNKKENIVLSYLSNATNLAISTFQGSFIPFSCDYGQFIWIKPYFCYCDSIYKVTGVKMAAV